MIWEEPEILCDRIDYLRNDKFHTDCTHWNMSNCYKVWIDVKKNEFWNYNQYLETNKCVLNVADAKPF